ncbi:MAG: hypothetical protein H5T86_09325 [Armatimonadetes bacterium]|nr:hypothetical protein [Armatimonadota bacterium]
MNTPEPPVRFSLPTAGVHMRCKVCRLAADNPEAFHLINWWLINGERLRDIAEEARKRWGIRLGDSTLSTHRRRHLLPYVASHQSLSANIAAIHDLLAQTPSEDIASKLSKYLVMPLLQALRGMPAEEIARLPTEKKIKLGLEAARTLAQCMKATADVHLAQANVQLKMIKLRQDERSLLLQAFSILRRELQQQAPALLAQLQQVLDHVEVAEDDQ